MADDRAAQAGWVAGFDALPAAERRARLEADPNILLPGRGSFDARRRAAWERIKDEEAQGR